MFSPGLTFSVAVVPLVVLPGSPLTETLEKLQPAVAFSPKLRL